MRILIFGLIAQFIFMGPTAARPIDEGPGCARLLDFIYKELTLQNMDKSVKRLNYKMVLALAQVMENVDKREINLRKSPEILSLIESMADIDKSLGPWLESNTQYRRYEFWNFFPFHTSEYQKVSYKNIVRKWKDLQARRPSLFDGLEKDYRLDDWDLKSASLLENYSELKISGHELKSDLDQLAKRYSQNLKELEGGFQTPGLTLRHTKDMVDRLHESFRNDAGKILASSLDEHEKACSTKDFNAFLASENLSCPVPGPESAASQFSDQLQELSKVVGAQLINSAAAPKEPVSDSPSAPKERVKIIEHEYKNVNYQGNFCERSPKMVDTAVVHHSGTDNKDSPQKIHDTQIVMHENDRDASGSPDPWYMIAYNYVIKSPYSGEAGAPKVYRGRPDKMKGAHAGAYVNLDQVDKEAKKELLKGPITCGYNSDEDPGHSLDVKSSRATKLTMNQISSGYVSANITSVGVMVTGNYAPDILGGRPNPSGYPRYGAARYPTMETLKTTAGLICQLREGDYPNLKKISDHNWIKIKKDVADGRSASGTCCPGTVYKRMNALLKLVKKECPEFDFKLDISPKDKVCRFLR